MKRLIVGLALFLAACGADLADLRTLARPLNNGVGSGSAVVIAPGFVLTAQHVAANGGFKLRKDGPVGMLLASLTDPDGDLGLLWFPAKEAQCPCVELAAYEAEMDEAIYVIGYPLGIAQVITMGRAQGVQRVQAPDMFGSTTDLGLRLITTGLADPGNSGGGVFVLRNGRFQLVGILTEKAGNLSMAVPLATIRPFLEANL
jgi:S1-C subfamily serine protease